MGSFSSSFYFPFVVFCHSMALAACVVDIHALAPSFKLRSVLDNRARTSYTLTPPRIDLPGCLCLQ
jgi:hypothetical protein